VLHEQDKPVLEQIQNYFTTGAINKHGSNGAQFQVRSVKDLKLIIDHFDKYPLITQKQADYLLFKEVFELMLKNEHLTEEGYVKS
jgi:hypothetical protein